MTFFTMSSYVNTNIFMPVFVLFFFLSSFNSYVTACPGQGPEHETEFAYDKGTGRGPSQWAHLNSSWYLCGNGTRQSPTKILGTLAQFNHNLGNLQANYAPTNATLHNRGHDIQVAWTGDAGNLVIDGTNYKLLQAHWHTPAEHKINGKSHAMEIHLVHKSNTGQIAVIGILYIYGPPDPFLTMLYRQILSLQNGMTQKELGIVNPSGIVKFNENPIKYYRYSGSLTTPPCSENVIWTLLQKVKTVSMQQVQALKAAVDEGYEENARPLQALNGRPVYKNGQRIF